MINTPNMSLIQPTIGIDSGLTWEQSLNSNSTILDSHNHSSGSGVQINPTGIDVNADLPFNGNNVTLLRTVRFQQQSAISGAPDLNCLYVQTDGNLYFNDGAGDASVQLTKAGSVNATSSGITAGTASASFVSSILVVTSSTGIGAAIDAGTYILRYSGSYPSPYGNYIALEAPSSLATGYSIQFPAALPAANNSLVTENTTGQLSYTNIDNSTLSISGGVMSAVPSAIVGGLSGITGSQLANNTVGKQQLAAGSVASVNYSGSTSNSSFTTVATTSAITTYGGPVLIMLTSETMTATGGSPNEFTVQILRNGTTATSFNSLGLVVNGPQQPMNICTIDQPAAGSNYWVLQIKAQNGSTVTSSFVSLVAYEL